uniref:Transketolase-like pyrimidine-binding domain-containing protein n=1 Tax=Panagrolaimus sp. PS1159 TaxID=55785 RepID=A0AC35F9Z0_9BILA
MFCSALSSLTMATDQISKIGDAANRMRISAIDMTCASKSGHPTSSASAAEIVATLFFGEMRYSVEHPRHVGADRFILSKGHACPILYAAWEEAGLLTREQTLTLRKIDSDIEGHPTPRLNFIDVATGSLGQGLGYAAGMAYVGKYVDKASYRVYTLLGDGESSEGAVWEAAAFSAHYKLDNLVAIVDVNRLGQSEAAPLGHNIEMFADRFRAFGFHAIVVDGHDVAALLKAFAEAKTIKNKPTAILCKTFKGKGIKDVEDQDNWHGKPVAAEAVKEIQARIKGDKPKWNIPSVVTDVKEHDLKLGSIKMSSPPSYKLGDKIATRQAYGTALTKLADTCKQILAFDADTKNSTFSIEVLKKHPEQFVECFIAEQNMVSAAIGAGCRDRTIPFCSTFAAFFTRAADQIRMGAISFANVKLCGSHAGISIGEDGPSQMALEDLALFRTVPNSVVFYPSDGTSAERAVELAANIRGIVFIRTGRPALPVLYEPNEHFEVGKAKVLKNTLDGKGKGVVLIGSGVTLYEALKAHDELNSAGIKSAVIDLFTIKPIDTNTILETARAIGENPQIITIEDHYQAGGIGEAVASAVSSSNDKVRVHSIFVKDVPRSGPPDALLDMFGISAKHIVAKAKSIV